MLKKELYLYCVLQGQLPQCLHAAVGDGSTEFQVVFSVRRISHHLSQIPFTTFRAEHESLLVCSNVDCRVYFSGRYLLLQVSCYFSMITQKIPKFHDFSMTAKPVALPTGGEKERNRQTDRLTEAHTHTFLINSNR